MSSSWCPRGKHCQAARGGVPKYVSNHLIYDILLRTPAESLLVFKSVCKAWYAIIKNPKFVKEHCAFHATKESTGLILISRTRNISTFDLTIMYNWCESENVIIHNLGRGREKPLRIETKAKSMVRFVSCNGLVCFHTDYPLLMCNPVTREFVKIPKPRRKIKERLSGCGFGATNNVYKVVQIFRRLDDSTMDYKVLTLGTNMSWRRPIQQQDKLLHPDFMEDENGQGSIFVDGSLYWPARNYNILCFDVTTERFKLIQAPMMLMMRGLYKGHELVELDKSLCVINYKDTSDFLHIKKMQKDCVDEDFFWEGEFLDVSRRIGIPDHSMRPVCSRSKKIYLRYRNGLACYNTENKESIAPVFTVRAENGFEFVAYTKSLVCLKDIVGSSSVSVLSTYSPHPSPLRLPYDCEEFLKVLSNGQ